MISFRSGFPFQHLDLYFFILLLLCWRLHGFGHLVAYMPTTCRLVGSWVLTCRSGSSNCRFWRQIGRLAASIFVTPLAKFVSLITFAIRKTGARGAGRSRGFWTCPFHCKHYFSFLERLDASNGASSSFSSLRGKPYPNLYLLCFLHLLSTREHTPFNISSTYGGTQGAKYT